MFSNQLIRCSSIYKIMTPPKIEADRKAGKLGATCTTYLNTLAREVIYQRKEEWSSKYTEKGLYGEEDALTILALTIRKNVKKNTVRLENDFLSGEPDTYIGKSIMECEEGFDTKCSWDIWTFPYQSDKLDTKYEWQNHGYMALTGAKRWTTAYTLINASGKQVTREKEMIWYQMGCPEETNLAYQEKAIEVEKNMIFDYEQFRKDNPYYDFTCKEWKYDIPRSERIKLFTVERDEQKIHHIYWQVGRCRAYLNEQYGNLLPSVLIASKDEQGTIIVESCVR